MTPTPEPHALGGAIPPSSAPAAENRPRVALLEDRLAIAQAMAVLLRQTPGLRFVGYAHSEGTLHELLSGATVDVLLVDLELAGVDGLAVVARATAQWPRMRWVALADAPDESVIKIEGNQYFPPDSIVAGVLESSATPYHCSWKGDCQYFNVRAGDELVAYEAWSYPEPIRSSFDIVGKD